MSNDIVLRDEEKAFLGTEAQRCRNCGHLRGLHDMDHMVTYEYCFLYPDVCDCDGYEAQDVEGVHI